MILGAHLKLWSEIFSLQYLPKGRWITIGYQDIHPKVRQIEGFQFADLKELLQQRGVDVTTLDFFDQRADLKFDLNEPVGGEYSETFDMLLDIGSIEHVYDTRQAFTNHLGMVKTGGYICIHTPVSGYFRHGLHTFHPETVRESLRQNGCTVCYEKFTTSSGQILLEADLKNRNALIWIVAQKTSRFEKFVNPQQGRYANAEGKPSHSVIGDS
ncbi:MAG: 2-polyprenyl-3-methyl-5-hydroxy-6-metoxy-1,4-benzoquinol methylase [Planctomycetaceae bacterium]|jgi:2-polyprenyl-3-methyl-5-hydroxy-6-metoxy-1,4-benzoquinol methylase